MKIVFEDKLKSSELKCGYLISEISVKESSDELKKLIQNESQELRNRMKIEDLEKDETAKSYRKLWWNFKIDPTKLRPSGEALIRRILLGKGLYLINNFVDCFNLVSIQTGLSIGAHDIEKLSGNITIKLARNGEKFIAIGSKGEMVLKGGELVVSDDKNVLDLAYSTSSCELTKITKETKKAILTVYTPEEISVDYINECLEKLINYLIKFSNAKVLERGVVIA
jgi:DNA/RNA-binding domain of Phe-tRNA-synthetase-like protein